MRWIACPQTLNRGRGVLPRLFVSLSAGRLSLGGRASFLPTHRFESVSQMTKIGTHHPPRLMLPLCQKWTAEFFCENPVRSLLSKVSTNINRILRSTFKPFFNFHLSFNIFASFFSSAEKNPSRGITRVRDTKNSNLYSYLWLCKAYSLY